MALTASDCVPAGDPWEEDPDADEKMLLHYPYGQRRKSEGRRAAEGAKASCMDIFTLGMVPPGIGATLHFSLVVLTVFLRGDRA